MLGAGGVLGTIQAALADEVKKGITHMKGRVTVDGKPAALGQLIRAGQTVATGPDSEVVFVLGPDAFMLREKSELAIEGKIVVSALRFITGKVLSVFGKGAKQLRTPTATIGIRGTACYIEAEAGSTYFCLCYGEAELIPSADPTAREIIRTQHHERPLAISNKSGGAMMAKAPVINHTDAELIMLESLVGRKPPFYGKSYTGYY
ncbi:MAG: hypothetical protein HYS18_13920 [Burkholderiales bacterium]|nr:hypothetical protein [Burkholderiales bacterium]